MPVDQNLISYHVTRWHWLIAWPSHQTKDNHQKQNRTKQKKETRSVQSLLKFKMQPLAGPVQVLFRHETVANGHCCEKPVDQSVGYWRMVVHDGQAPTSGQYSSLELHCTRSIYQRGRQCQLELHTHGYNLWHGHSIKTHSTPATKASGGHRRSTANTTRPSVIGCQSAFYQLIELKSIELSRPRGMVLEQIESADATCATNLFP